MKRDNIYQFMSSSSATGYGISQYLLYDEARLTQPISPDGQTKLQVENILSDLVKSGECWSIACLHYFNPIGALPSHLIGEPSNDQPNNLMPHMTQALAKQRPFLIIFCNDYNSRDGTGGRDYIHLVDLVEGHIAALRYIQCNASMEIINLRTGISDSILEMLRTFESSTGQVISTQIGGRRAGDVPVYFASDDKAKTILHWGAKRSLEQMCEPAWLFQLQHQSKRSIVN